MFGQSQSCVHVVRPFHEFIASRVLVRVTSLNFLAVSYSGCPPGADVALDIELNVEIMGRSQHGSEWGCPVPLLGTCEDPEIVFRKSGSEFRSVRR